MSSLLEPKSHKTLSCVLCQQRKIKCDRGEPCSRCVKSGAMCIPSIPAAVKKRRILGQALLERVGRCEQILQDLALHAADVSPGTDSHGNNNIQSSASQRFSGKLVSDQNGLRYIDDCLAATVTEEVRTLREAVDDELQDLNALNPVIMEQSSHQADPLLFTNLTDSESNYIHPGPAHILKLWQIYIDRVHPLTKFIHLPTVQLLVVEATSSPATLSRDAEALLFSIYAITTGALSATECQSILGVAQGDALTWFWNGTQNALMRVGILSKSSITTLQAFVLYITSLCGRHDRHAVWILCGTAIRIAQKLGLHRDGMNLGQSPFDAELGRRIWWHIVVLDVGASHVTGLGQSLLPQYWDTREPANVNDSDLYPTMEKVIEKSGPSEMAFCKISYPIAKFLTKSSSIQPQVLLGGTAADLLASTHPLAGQKRIYDLDAELNTRLKMFSDPTMGPVHEFANELRIMMIKRLHEHDHFVEVASQPGIDYSTAQDELFRAVVRTAGISLNTYAHVYEKGLFPWFVKLHFHADSLLFIAGQLCHRVSGHDVEKAWLMLEKYYGYHDELFDLSIDLHRPLALHVVKAWNAYNLPPQIQTAEPAATPHFISRLGGLLATTNSRSNDDLATQFSGNIADDILNELSLSQNCVADVMNISSDMLWGV